MTAQKLTSDDIDKLNNILSPCIDELNCVDEYKDLCKEKNVSGKKLHLCTTISDDGMQLDIAVTNDNFFNKFLEPFIANVVVGFIQSAIDSVCRNQYKVECNDGSISIKKVG